MLRWFEKRLDPYPAAPPAQPPRSLYALCRHYTRGAEPWLALMALLTPATAITEVSLYAFTGSIVDRLSSHTPASFLQAEGWNSALIAAGVLLVSPALTLLSALLIHQALPG